MRPYLILTKQYIWDPGMEWYRSKAAAEWAAKTVAEEWGCDNSSPMRPDFRGESAPEDWPDDMGA